MRSRNLFVNLRRSVPQAGIEDFVTEALCWLLATHPAIQARLLDRILGPGDHDTQWIWRTQVNLVAGDDRSRPDLVGDSEHHLLLIECKIDAPVVPDQIAAHRRNAVHEARGRRLVVALIARHPNQQHTGDASISWREVQNLALLHTPDASRESMASQFHEFLGMEGLGRIAGPCPTFWKASILEARQRDASKGMSRGYHSLGHKFAAAVLPQALEDLADEGDDTPLRDALDVAMESPDPDRSVWRVCRSFFPSYLFRDDSRFGPLRINDRQGLAFARGIIEFVQENGLP